MASDIKEREHATWSANAAGWAKHDDRLTEHSAIVTQRLLDAAAVGPGMRVLDLASGTGNPALPAAVRVGASGHVLGTDLAEPMIEVARAKARRLALDNIELRVADAEQLELPPESFDAVTIRWGLMFMPDPAACLRRCHAALRPGGRIALTAWAEPERNLWNALPARVLARFISVPPIVPGEPGVYQYADGEKLRRELAEAGFRDVTIEEVTVSPVGAFPSGAAWVEFLFDLFSPTIQLARGLPADQLAAYRAALATEAEATWGGNNVPGPGVTWLASATK
jgi:ubiquinone/menaquinone biosynthesis C-methylase UbiE